MLHMGIARRELTPFWGVELTGWGYYIERRWQSVRDPLQATALAADDGERTAIVVALDLMVIDERFTRATRARIQAATGVPPEAILLTCSHSHNAPAAGGLLGVGECDPVYEDWASRQAATAAILAWRQREPARLWCGRTDVNELTFNRTRSDGVIDPTLTVARFDRADGSPLAIVVNFGAHPTVWTELWPTDVTRDIPGAVCDGLETAYPGATTMYLQGACGDVNFHRHFVSTDRCHEPARKLVAEAKEAIAAAVRTDGPVAFDSRMVELPTRRWTHEEIDHDRAEAERRLRDSDITGWRETIGRSMTNRPEDMVRRHGGDEAKAVRAMCRFHLEWTDRMLRDLDMRPETLATEVQAVRIGGLCFVANSSEFFSPFALDVRQRANVPALMLACYANGRIGYLPDAHDIAARSYAGYQSPKYCNQFPFTPASGPAMCDAMVATVARVRATAGRRSSAGG
jgi:neutral ceramidase